MGRPPRRRGRRRSGAAKKSPASAKPELTSHPTGRGAQVATRAWLLDRYGPHCAYCGVKFAPRVMTLDHVAPRRGLTAYDRRDNLVLACRGCNALKRDQAPMAFLLASKARAANLLSYGAHLSHGLLELAKSLVGDAPPPKRHVYGPDPDDEESPYRD